MKCPRCGYISFDHLDTCKSCGKNVASARDLVNVTSVRPNTPFLLGSLVGAEEMSKPETLAKIAKIDTGTKEDIKTSLTEFKKVLIKKKLIDNEDLTSQKITKT